jgi:hypothetical protein
MSRQGEELRKTGQSPIELVVANQGHDVQVHGPVIRIYNLCIDQDIRMRIPSRTSHTYIDFRDLRVICVRTAGIYPVVSVSKFVPQMLHSAGK